MIEIRGLSMDQDLGFCGIYCRECPAYIAKRDNDQKLREEASKGWKRAGYSYEAEKINCDGCQSNGELLEYCAICEVRNCALAKGVSSCAHCNEYPCSDKLEPLWKQLEVPQAKENLDELIKSRKI